MEFAVGLHRLSEIGRGDFASCGFKGANLGELNRLDAFVPAGFVVPVQYYREHADRCGLHEALAQPVDSQDWDAVEETAVRLLSAFPLNVQLQSELSEAFVRLDATEVAVRSSATAEDLAGASFAGQYRTLLNIRSGDEVLKAVRKCWASLWCREVLEYRQRRSLDHFDGEMAVVVQSMFPAEIAGVLFTIDPVSQRSDRLLIEIVAGLGEALVTGTTSGAVFRVDRITLQVVDREGAEETLSSEQLEELCRLALEVEGHFECPQDIEFAFRHGQLALLQARPITALGRSAPEELDPLGKPSLADRIMKPLVAERYPIAPRPLDNLVYTRLVGAAIASLRRSGVIVIAENEAMFRAEIWRQAYRFPPHRYTWMFLGSTWQMLKLLRTNWIEWWNGGPGPTLRREASSVDLTELNDSQLFERTEHLLAIWEEPLNQRMFAASAYRAEPLLKFLIMLAVGKHKCAGSLASLMSGLQHPTIDANAELWRLSRLARKSPFVFSAIQALAPERLQTTPEGREFAREFAKFLAEFGHRETACWYLSTPTWRSEPKQVWRLLRSMTTADRPPPDTDTTQDTYNRTRATIEHRLRLLPGLPALFGGLLDSLRSLTEFRELSHFDLTRVQQALQEVATEWSRRLVARGILHRTDDVFYLTYDEVRDWLLGSTVPTPEEIQRLVAKRRATYQVANTRWQHERLTAIHTVSTLKGIATSPGVATGKVRIVRGEHQFERLLPGEILVCPFTTPAWTPLFSSAAAVVTETGGAASHASIVAREYGIPAVMSVPGVMHMLSDEDEVVVDGNSGTVSRVGIP